MEKDRLSFCPPLTQRSLGRRQVRYGDPKRRAAYVIKPHLLAEGDALGIPAMLATNPSFKLGIGRPAFF